MKKHLFVLSCILSLSFHAHAQSLKGTKWSLRAIYDDTNQNILKDTLMKGTLKFKTDSTYEGSFCNDYYGTYRSGNKDALLMKKPMATRKFCGNGFSELESRLYTYYGTTNVYILEGNELSLISDKGKLVFVKQ